jgi:uncharacterized LabA/DUF88 family protein
MARTIVYIDGLNLYYRALRKTHFKWLDIHALCVAALPASADIIGINYYTANISSKVSSINAPARQQVYLNALETLPLVSIVKGKFQISDIWIPLKQPIRFEPPCKLEAGANARKIKALDVQEKNSDVNLAVHLVRDACKGRFDAAAILTSDTDLLEAMRIVTQELNLPLTLLDPGRVPPISLEQYATAIVPIRKFVATSQFSNTLIGKNGERIVKPREWGSSDQWHSPAERHNP